MRFIGFWLAGKEGRGGGYFVATILTRFPSLARSFAPPPLPPFPPDPHRYSYQATPADGVNIAYKFVYTYMDRIKPTFSNLRKRQFVNRFLKDYKSLSEVGSKCDWLRSFLERLMGFKHQSARRELSMLLCFSFEKDGQVRRKRVKTREDLKI